MTWEKALGARRTRPKERSYEGSTFFNIFNPFRKHKDVSRFETTFLVVKYEEGCSEVRFQMPHMSTGEDRTPET